MDLRDGYQRYMLTASFEETERAQIIAGGGIEIGELRQQAGLGRIVKQHGAAEVPPGLAEIAESSRGPA